MFVLFVCDCLQAKEEVEALEKKIIQLENELTSTTSALETSNTRLEEREKALQNVSVLCMVLFSMKTTLCFCFLFFSC